MMETFAKARQFVDNPGYKRDREGVIAALNMDAIDAPIRGIISALAVLPECYTLQCCYGHFVHGAQQDHHNLEAVPFRDVGQVLYRIAYLALCIENSTNGWRLRSLLEEVPAIDPEYVQFGSPEWFWNSHLNSFALQVEPSRFMYEDVAVIAHGEALHVQEIRMRFFERLKQIVEVVRGEPGAA
jgi:hypothetical protein